MVTVSVYVCVCVCVCVCVKCDLCQFLFRELLVPFPVEQPVNLTKLLQHSLELPFSTATLGGKP